MLSMVLHAMLGGRDCHILTMITNIQLIACLDTACSTATSLLLFILLPPLSLCMQTLHRLHWSKTK